MPQVTPKARSLFDPRVERFLIADEGEVIVDEVAKHWAAIVKPVMLLVAALPLLIIAFWVPPEAWWVPALAAVVLAGWGLWRILQAQMDRFVITNMRVFRVHGILTQNISTMPLARILDISVHRPVVGRMFGFGHFVFESAAQTQGLKEIRYVGAPNERDLTIQRVISRAGLRGPVRNGTQPQPSMPPMIQHQRPADPGDGPDGYRDGGRDELGPNDTMPIHL